MANRWQGTFLFALALSLQCAFSMSGKFFDEWNSSLYGDSWILHTMARNFMEKGVFSYTDADATLLQLPAFPALISAFYKTFGMDARYLLVFQMVIGSAIVGVLATQLRKYLGNWSWVFGVLMVIDLHRLLYSSCLLTEFWVYLFWILAWICFMSFVDKTSWYWLFACVFFLAAAAWFKPLAGYFPPLAILGFVVVKPRFFVARFKPLCLSLIFFAFLMLPLLLRNHSVSGQFPRYTNISSFNSVYFNVVYYEAQKLGISVYEARHKWVNRMREKLNAEQSREIPEISAEVANGRHAHRKALGLNEHEYCRLADEMFGEFFKNEGRGYLLNHFQHGIKIFTISNLSWLKYFYHDFNNRSFSSVNLKKLWAYVRTPDREAYFFFLRIYEIAFVFACILFLLIGLMMRPALFLSQPFVVLAFFFMIYVYGVCGVNVWGRFRLLFMPQLLFLAVLGLKCIHEARIKKAEGV